MRFGARSAIDAWRELASAPPDGRISVTCNPDSWLAPPGWIGIVAIGDVITVTVPRDDLVQPVALALDEMTGRDATSAAVAARALPWISTTLGPAELFYPPEGFDVAHRRADAAPAAGNRDEVVAFLAAADSADLEESGVSHIESSAFVSRAGDGTIASVCGYRRWPNGVAHMSVLTGSHQRASGHGRAAAAIALRHAIDEGLLPQWRARPIASQRLALAVGLVHMGTQLSVQPPPAGES